MKQVNSCENTQSFALLCRQEPQPIGLEDPVRQMSIMVEPPPDPEDEKFRAALQNLKNLQPSSSSDSLLRFLEKAPSRPSVSQTSAGDIAGGIFSLLTLGIFSATGCSTLPASARHPVTTQGDMRLRWDLSGQAEIGTLIFIRQIHFPFLDFLNERKIKTSTLLAVGKYQWKILQLLEEYGPKHLFLEGLDRDLPPSLHSKWVSELRRDLKEAGVQLPENMTDEEKEKAGLVFLAVLGAGLVYGINHSEAYLHRTHSEEESRFVLERIRSSLKRHDGDLEAAWNDPALQHMIREQRENWAVRELIDFFSNHPGENAYLIYGAAHQFCDDFARTGMKIRASSVWWDLPGQEISPRVPLPCE